MATSGVKMVRDDVAALLAGIKRLSKMDVLVGIPSNRAERDDGEPINNAQLAYIQTYGSTIQVDASETTIYRKRKADGSFANGGKFVKKSKSNFATTHDTPAHEIVIPPRPFLEPGVVNAQPETTPRLRAAAELGLKGDFAGAEGQLETAGILAVNAVRAVIGAGINPPLAKSTLASRRARGRTGTIPLKDTAEMNNSITYVVRKTK